MPNEDVQPDLSVTVHVPVDDEGEPVNPWPLSTAALRAQRIVLPGDDDFPTR